MRVAGVDGFKAGWVVAFLEEAPGGLMARVEVAERFIAVRDRTKGCTAVAVDIPIGLPDRGPRECDLAARARLGARSSCVFTAPVRGALSARSRAAASRITRKVAGVGTTAQTFALLHKILEVDQVIDRRLQKRIFEVHPELCFLGLNGGTPLEFPKKSAIGALSRLRLLQAVGIDTQAVLRGWEATARPGLEGKVGLDDVLDALAAAWTARRRVQGVSHEVTDEQQRDAKGLLMQMTW